MAKIISPSKLAKQRKMERLLKWKHYFCSSTKRPNGCLYPDTNLCCVVCENNQTCSEQHKGKPGIKPCIKDDFELGEECELLC